MLYREDMCDCGPGDAAHAVVGPHGDSVEERHLLPAHGLEAPPPAAHRRIPDEPQHVARHRCAVVDVKLVRLGHAGEIEIGR